MLSCFFFSNDDVYTIYATICISTTNICERTRIYAHRQLLHCMTLQLLETSILETFGLFVDTDKMSPRSTSRCMSDHTSAAKDHYCTITRTIRTSVLERQLSFAPKIVSRQWWP